MPVDESLYTRSQAHAGLSALIGTRFYPEKELSGTPTFPYVVFRLVSVLEVVHTFQTPTDFETDAQWEMAVWATSHDEASDVAKQIRLAFYSWTDGTVTTLFVDEAELPEDDEHIFRRVLDFQVTAPNDDT